MYREEEMLAHGLEEYNDPKVGTRGQQVQQTEHELFELYKKQTLMRTSNHAFLISVYYVGLQLFLIFFLVSFSCRLFLRFAFRINNTFHSFTDRKLVQYAKARSYCLY